MWKVLHPVEGGRASRGWRINPGVNLVKLNITEPDGQVVERRFKYFMPSTLVTSKPISLIFEFHGSYEFKKDETFPSDPLEGLSKTHALCRLATPENCIVCFPAGEVVTQEDGSGAVNWQNSEKHLPFVDAMLDFFMTSSPSVDPLRGLFHGTIQWCHFFFRVGILSFGEICGNNPRAGQMNIDNQTQLPSRAVPIRVFAGEIDQTVIHSAVLQNMEQWAIRNWRVFPGRYGVYRKRS